MHQYIYLLTIESEKNTYNTIILQCKNLLSIYQKNLLKLFYENFELEFLFKIDFNILNLTSNKLPITLNNKNCLKELLQKLKNINDEINNLYFNKNEINISPIHSISLDDKTISENDTNFEYLFNKIWLDIDSLENTSIKSYNEFEICNKYGLFTDFYTIGNNKNNEDLRNREKQNKFENQKVEKYEMSLLYNNTTKKTIYLQYTIELNELLSYLTDIIILDKSTINLPKSLLYSSIEHIQSIIKINKMLNEFGWSKNDIVKKYKNIVNLYID